MVEGSELVAPHPAPTRHDRRRDRLCHGSGSPWRLGHQPLAAACQYPIGPGIRHKDRKATGLDRHRERPCWVSFAQMIDADWSARSGASAMLRIDSHLAPASPPPKAVRLEAGVSAATNNRERSPPLGLHRPVQRRTRHSGSATPQLKPDWSRGPMRGNPRGLAPKSTRGVANRLLTRPQAADHGGSTGEVSACACRAWPCLDCATAHRRHRSRHHGGSQSKRPGPPCAIAASS